MRGGFRVVENPTFGILREMEKAGHLNARRRAILKHLAIRGGKSTLPAIVDLVEPSRTPLAPKIGELAESPHMKKLVEVSGINFSLRRGVDSNAILAFLKNKK